MKNCTADSGNGDGRNQEFIFWYLGVTFDTMLSFQLYIKTITENDTVKVKVDSW